MEATEGRDFSRSFIVWTVREDWRYVSIRFCLADGGRVFGACGWGDGLVEMLLLCRGNGLPLGRPDGFYR